MESLHLSTMHVTYNQHFALCSQKKKNLTQHILFVVWKFGYVIYKHEYLESQFQDDTLKERLHETLKISKLWVHQMRRGQRR